MKIKTSAMIITEVGNDGIYSATEYLKTPANYS